MGNESTSGTRRSYIAQNMTDGNNSRYVRSEEETNVFVDLVYKKKNYCCLVLSELSKTPTADRDGYLKMFLSFLFGLSPPDRGTASR